VLGGAVVVGGAVGSVVGVGGSVVGGGVAPPDHDMLIAYRSGFPAGFGVPNVVGHTPNAVGICHAALPPPPMR
jgi:hypothetical protein